MFSTKENIIDFANHIKKTHTAIKMKILNKKLLADADRKGICFLCNHMVRYESDVGVMKSYCDNCNTECIYAAGWKIVNSDEFPNIAVHLFRDKVYVMTNGSQQRYPCSIEFNNKQSFFDKVNRTAAICSLME